MKNKRLHQTYKTYKNLSLCRNAYADFLNNLIMDISPVCLNDMVYVLKEALNNEATIYVMGNGGSAATAMHFVNDLCKMAKSKTSKFKAMCLSDNISWFSALGNDEGYDNVFKGQLDNFVKEGDVVIGLTASGNSENVVKAFKLANKKNATTFALVGFDGGKLKEITDYYIHVKTDKGEYGAVEDAHSIVCHLITMYLSFVIKEKK